jgi:Icc protein
MRRHGTDKEVYVTEPGNVKSLGIRQRSLPLVTRSNVLVAMVVPRPSVVGWDTMTTIAQLSDLHLSDDDPYPLEALRAAVAALLDLPAPPDCVVLTGDLADHGRPSEYAQLREALTPLPMPVHPLPGNHDDVTALLTAFSSVPSANYAVAAGDVRLVCCDSTIPGENGGRLSDPEWLDATLSEAPDTPTVVAMHHPPFRLGVEWVDAMGHARPETLAGVISGHPQVVRVIAGHVHTGAVTEFAGTVATSCPSTWRQIYLDPDGPPALSTAPPGMALHVIDGMSAVTHFRPIGDRPLGDV